MQLLGHSELVVACCSEVAREILRCCCGRVVGRVLLCNC